MSIEQKIIKRAYLISKDLPIVDGELDIFAAECLKDKLILISELLYCLIEAEEESHKIPDFLKPHIISYP